jgi:peroxiredoxin
MKAIFLFTFLILFSVESFAQKQSAEWFSVESVSGKKFDLTELRGKVVVLYFWSTTCPICESISPKLNIIADKYSNGKVIYLAVTSDRIAKVESFLKNHKFSFDVVTGNFDIIFKYGDKGKDGDFSMPYPTLFVINQEGKLDLKTVGTKSSKEVETALERLTAQ